MQARPALLSPVFQVLLQILEERLHLGLQETCLAFSQITGIRVQSLPEHLEGLLTLAEGRQGRPQLEVVDHGGFGFEDGLDEFHDLFGLAHLHEVLAQEGPRSGFLAGQRVGLEPSDLCEFTPDFGSFIPTSKTVL